MDDMNLDRSIRETLHSCADTLSAPDDMKIRVNFALQNPVKRRRHSWRKMTVALVAVAAVAVVGAVAGGMGSITSHSWSDQRLSYADTLSHMQGVSADATAPEAFANGFTFNKGYDTETTAENAGASEDRSAVTAVYTKDGVELALSVQKPYTVFGDFAAADKTNESAESADAQAVAATGGESAEGKVTATKEVNGVTLSFCDQQYLFVPVDYTPTDEQAAAEKAGDLAISYGSDEVETSNFQSVEWEKDGLSYMLSGAKTGLDADTFFTMASELIGA